MEAVVIFVENFWRVIEGKQNTIVEVIAVNMMLLNDDFGSGDMHCLGGNLNLRRILPIKCFKTFIMGIKY